MKDKPNPGSDEAIEEGCTCAVIDNSHGKWPVYVDEDGNEMWWITSTCPVHGFPSFTELVADDER